MSDRTTCARPDIDVPGLRCGVPLPCPRHTVTIDLRTDPAQITEPVTARIRLRERRRLIEIADVLREARDAE